MKQLEAMQKNGKKVLGGTNADFFNTTYIPYGVCYRDGVAVKTSFSRTDCNVFVITKDNEACCFTEEEYALHKDIVREAVCGLGTLLLKNGEQLDQSGNTMPVAKMEPRTAIGVSQDGKEVYLMVVDGRNFYYSNGADLLDLMNLMSACGACDALNLDGGGSATFIARDGAEGELKLLNWPTDQGGVMPARIVATIRPLLPRRPNCRSWRRASPRRRPPRTTNFRSNRTFRGASNATRTGCRSIRRTDRATPRSR